MERRAQSRHMVLSGMLLSLADCGTSLQEASWHSWTRGCITPPINFVMVLAVSSCNGDAAWLKLQQPPHPVFFLSTQHRAPPETWACTPRGPGGDDTPRIAMGPATASFYAYSCVNQLSPPEKYRTKIVSGVSDVECAGVSQLLEWLSLIHI